MSYLIEFKVREPIEENWNRALEVNTEREKAGKGFVARKVLKNRYIAIGDGIKIIQIVETDDPSIIAEWVEAYRNFLKFEISMLMTGEEYGLVES